MEILLETDRLILRQITVGDVDRLVELDSDPDVKRYINGGTSTSREEMADEYIPYFLEFYQRFSTFGFWAIVEKASDDFLGWFHFRPIKDHSTSTIELGYRLKKSAWGKGYGTEGSRALIDLGFRDPEVKRVVASAFTANHDSRRIMEKCGMLLERVYHEELPFTFPGIEEGMVDYSIERSRWESLKAESPAIEFP